MSQILSPPQFGRPRRYKTSIACTTCRRRKLKCDGRRPACGRCQDHNHGEGCSYVHNIDGRRNVNISRQPRAITDAAPLPPNSSLPLITTPTATDPDSVADSLSGTYDPGGSTEFASRVRAAIDNSLGLPPVHKRCPIPLTDAPLFGETAPQFQAVSSGINSAIDNVLPARKQADDLVNLYWQHLEPCEPLFDQSRFSHNYEAFFAGRELDCDERVFSSTLNGIFALSTQLQEWLPREQRDEASKNFFQRAWSLLRPEVILWEPGSMEVVQALILLARYLQCTRSVQQTWMAVSTAVHIARNLGLHSVRTRSSSARTSSWLERQVWQCCASIDRILSWTLGQTALTSLLGSSGTIDYGYNEAGSNSLSRYTAKMADLNEITSYIMLSQATPRNIIADSLGQPFFGRAATNMNVVTKIDGRLNQFEKSLSQFWGSESTQKGAEDSLKGKQRLIFDIRLAHTRILLFRPMLASFCLPRGISAPIVQGVESRVLQSCATLCMENVQRLITLVCDDYIPGDSSIETLRGGVLPWWYRFFYLYLAAQHLITAMMRADVFRHMVLDYWDKVELAICAHEHLSVSITRCISSFRNMWHKVVDSQDASGTQQTPETFQDLLQHLGFDSDSQNSFNFGVDDLTWNLGMADFDWNPDGFLDGGESFSNTELMSTNQAG